MEAPYSLLSELGRVAPKGRPPVQLWRPEREKDIDLRIAGDGVWYYQGAPIRRPRLVRLFASVLKREGDEYFLVTPAEKCRITVEDLPFRILLLDVAGAGIDMRLEVTTDMGERYPMDREHPLRMAPTPDAASGEAPCMLIRDGMAGRFNRNSYYRLAELMTQGAHPEHGDPWFGVWSYGAFFPMTPVAC